MSLLLDLLTLRDLLLPMVLIVEVIHHILLINLFYISEFKKGTEMKSSGDWEFQGMKVGVWANESRILG